MKLFDIAKNFAADESGAVTVDWVVLTAAIVGLGLAVMTTVGTQVSKSATAIATDIGTDVTAGSGLTFTQ